MAESFFSTLECELLDRYRFKTQVDARMAIFRYIEGWYNPRRRHSPLGYQSPMNFEGNHARRSAACQARGGTTTFSGSSRLLLPSCLRRPGSFRHPWVLGTATKHKYLPVHQFGVGPVLYLCDTTVSPLDLYRTLALELGVTPSHRRGQLWTDIKKTLLHMVDERHTLPLLVIDEAHHLSDRFLIDLSGFLNFAFDSRDLMAVWLVGLSPLTRTLRMNQHAPLAMRVAAHVHLEPLDRDDFAALLEHGLLAVGASSNLLSDPASEMLFRASRGIPRVASKLLRAALRIAHDRDHNFVDEHTAELAIEHMAFAPAVLA